MADNTPQKPASPLQGLLGNAVGPGSTQAPPGTYWNGMQYLPVTPNLGQYGWAAVACPPGSDPSAVCMAPLPAPIQAGDPSHTDVPCQPDPNNPGACPPQNPCVGPDGDPVPCGDPGGDIGGGSPGGDCTSGLCDCISSSNADISSALQDIADKLGNQTQFSCSDLDDCMDDIIDQLKDRLTVPSKTAEQCQADAQAGLAGTLEYALACAGQCCGQSTPTGGCTEGETCSGCGCEPCTCSGGTCTAVDPSSCEPSDKTYTAWCNPQTGEATAARSDEVRYDPPWVAVGDYPDLDSATSAAYLGCQGTQQPQAPYNPFTPITPPGSFCSATDYVNGNAFTTLGQTATALFQQMAAAKILNNVSQVGGFGLTFGTAGDALHSLVNMFVGGPPAMAQIFVPIIATAFGCSNAQFVQSLEMVAATNVIEKLSGVDFSEWLTPYKYAINAACRQKHLSPSQSVAAYLANAIDGPTLDAYWAIDGMCNADLNQYMVAAQAKLVPDQLLAAVRRDVITAEQYNEGMRRLGYINQDYVNAIYNSSFAIPGLSQIVDFETVQVEVEDTATALNLDDGLDNFKAGQSGKWLQSQGATDDYIKAIWREHWVSPAPSILTQLWHRYRNDPVRNANGQLQDDIALELQRQGINTHWLSLYTDLMLQPLDKRIAQRAYQYGAIDSQGLQTALEQQGYNDDAVNSLLDLSGKLQTEHLRSHHAIKQWISWTITGQQCLQAIQADGYDQQTAQQAIDDSSYLFQHSPQVEAFTRGLLSLVQLIALLTTQGVNAATAAAIANQASIKLADHPTLKAYIAGTTSRNAAVQAMVGNGMSADITNHLLDNVDADISAQQAIACQQGTKHRYLHGELNQAQAQANLVQYGVDVARANLLTSGWACEKSALGKPVMATELCGWLQEGIITQADFVNRLVTIGYTQVDAQLILNNCLIAYSRKLNKQAEQQAKQAQADATKQANAAKRAQASIDRQNAQLQKMREKNAKIRAGRDAMLISAAERLYITTQSALVDAIHKARDMVSLAEQTYGLSLDESLKLLTIAAEKYTGSDLAGFDADFQVLAQAEADSTFAPPDPPPPICPSSNGSTQP
jgi:hypothetical protein